MPANDSKKSDKPLDPLVQKVATFITENPGVQRSQVIDFLHDSGELKSSTSVWRYLNTAIDLGLITMQGITSTARYYPSEDVCIRLTRQQIGVPAMKRPRIAYNQEFLAQYQPNKSFYLSASRRDLLERRCPLGSAPIDAIQSRDMKLLMTGMPWGSAKLEGNAYDLASTQDLLLKGIEKQGGSQLDRVMLTNHFEAVDVVLKGCGYPPERDHMQVSPRDLRSIHYLLSRGLLRDPAEEGQLRRRPISIKDSTFVPADQFVVIQSAFEMLAAKASQIDNPYEAAFFLNVHLPYLQPFVDCNKRTARIACNIPLLRAGVMPMTWMDVHEEDYISGIIGVYELNETNLLAEVFTDSYMRSIERFEIMRNEQTPSPILVRYRDELRKVMRNFILHDDESLPITIDQKDMTGFLEYFDREVESLKQSDGLRIIQFGLKDADYKQWIRRQESRAAAREDASGRHSLDMFRDNPTGATTDDDNGADALDVEVQTEVDGAVDGFLAPKG